MHKIPPTGALLIQAGAGTGKTYTITSLYLQFLLGIGCERAFPVQELLLLTFTRAAAQDLKTRVTRRLQEARQAFQTGETRDEFLQDVLAQSTDRERDRKLLTAAIQLLDEAAIFTIHAFCAKVLGDQSFEAGTLFDQPLTDTANGDRERLLQLACEDCFRGDLLTLEPAVRDLALGIWATPDALAEQLKPFLYRGQLTLEPPFRPLEFDLEALATKARQAMQGWVEHDLEAVIKAANLNGRSKPVTRLEAMTAFCQAGDMDLQTELWAIYNQPALEKATKKKDSYLPTHPVLDLIDEIHRETSQIEPLKTNLWHTMIDSVRTHIRQNREKQQLMTVDDLLTGLEEALATPGLGATLATRWPVAMVDEYQDTDDIQSRIFDQIYQGCFRHQDGQRLVMIGDPRQAIYQFRGADVYTYLNAREQITDADHIWPLPTNRRSSALMVAANNDLFREPGIFGDLIAYDEVKPGPGHEQMALSIDNVDQSPYQLFCPGSVQYVDQAREAAMEYAAETTAQLLRGAAKGRVLVKGVPLKEPLEVPLEAGKIAFLVRTHKDAALARKALARREINSIYLTQTNVLQGDTAKDLLLILQAAAEPSSDRAVRAALGTRLLQCSAAELDRLDDDPKQQVMQEFHDYHDTWEKKNVGAMINALIVKRGLGAKWLPLPDGDRQLTDLRHLTEILQGCGATGFRQLLAWFTRQQQATAVNEQHQLRLESDANLVKIVTVHSAKGLEYDLVLLPWPVFASDPKKSEPALFHESCQGRHQTWVELGADEAHRKLAAQELRDEDMRLCYVALTRAKYRCYLGMPSYKGEKKFTQSALGRLLQLENRAEGDELKDYLAETLPEKLFEVVSTGQPGITRVAAATDLPQVTRPPALPTITDRWRIHSYSGILHSQPIASSIPGGGYADDEPPAGKPVSSAAPSRFTFPAGARIGIELHTLLEKADFTESQHTDLCLRTLERIGLAQEPWLEVLQTWLTDILHTPLLGGAVGTSTDKPLSLSRLTQKHRLDELEFHFPVSCPDGISQLLQSYRPAGNAHPLPASLPLEGMMTGFIDLVFRQGGKYYLADYKSNHLGDDPGAYTGERLEPAMLASHYDLQYLIYSIALHRFLGHRLADYDYEHHFGGVFYLFLRGMDGTDHSAGIYYQKPDSAVIRQLDALLRATP